MFRLCRLMLGLLLALFITPALSDSLPGSNSRGVQNRSAVAVETSVAADTTTTNRVNASSRRSAGRDRHSNVVPGASVARTGGNVVQRTGGINSTANNAARIAGRDDFGKTHDGRVERATKNRGGRVSATSSVVPRSVTAPVRAGVVSSGTKERRKNVAASTVLTRVPSQSKTARSTTSLTSGGTASLLKICQEQYTQCMDDFCNVLDDELGRCICSKNIKNYTKTSAAQKEAKDALQDIVQQIQYIGLTHAEVVTLLSQTEAELVMQKNTDKSQIKNSLDKIKDMIIDVKPRSSSAAVQDTGLSLDVGSLMNFDTGSVSFDVLSLFDGGKTGASISNQRGEQLYKTASAQCKKNILDACRSQGVNTDIIENSYDLAIDSSCLLYERSLTADNDDIVQTVRNAQNVLQRARLMVKKQKNIYDLRGCIGALDACVQDERVCGSDYEYCLDPMGKYIANGEIIVGSTPGYKVPALPSQECLMSTWYYDGKFAWASSTDAGSVSEYVDKYVTSSPVKQTSDKMAEYLQYKIGYNEKGKDYGLCMSVLNKCQDLTYDKNGVYIPNNQVITEYLQRTMIQIKQAQDALLDSYAESCVADALSCLKVNKFDLDATITAQNIAINACRHVIRTCMSVNDYVSTDSSLDALRQWVIAMMGGGKNSVDGDISVGDACAETGGSWSDGACACYATGTVANSDRTACVCDVSRNFAGVPSAMGCSCASGYTYQNGGCVLVAAVNCADSGGSWSGNACVCGGTREWNGFVCVDALPDDNADEVACANSGGEWTNGACVCSATGTVANSGRTACICDVSRNFAGTPGANGCSCASGYTYQDGDCVLVAAVDCANSGGKWTNGACVCSATGTVANSDRTACICDVSRDFAGVPGANGCSCASDYTYQDGECVLVAAVNCANSGGSWFNGVCTCSATGTVANSDRTACVCDVSRNFAGSPSANGCSCASDYIYQDGECVSVAIVNCINSGGEWVDNMCVCPEGTELNADVKACVPPGSVCSVELTAGLENGYVACMCDKERGFSRVYASVNHLEGGYMAYGIAPDSTHKYVCDCGFNVQEYDEASGLYQCVPLSYSEAARSTCVLSGGQYSDMYSSWVCTCDDGIGLRSDDNGGCQCESEFAEQTDWLPANAQERIDNGAMSLTPENKNKCNVCADESLHYWDGKYVDSTGAINIRPAACVADIVQTECQYGGCTYDATTQTCPPCVN